MANKVKSQRHVEAGRKGGTSTRHAMDSQFFARIGKKGGETTRERYGAWHFRRIGRIGARARIGDAVYFGRRRQEPDHDPLPPAA